MNPIICKICKSKNIFVENKILIIAVFSQKYLAEDALENIEKSHIIPVWSEIKNMKGMENLILELHGIKDITNLEALYIESICRENALAVDIFSTKKSYENILLKL